LRFHGSVEYGENGRRSIVGKPLPCVVEWMSAPYSTSTVSVRLSVSRQNSRSTSSSETSICEPSSAALAAKWRSLKLCAFSWNCRSE
jgi:hypothetical protein